MRPRQAAGLDGAVQASPGVRLWAQRCVQRAAQHLCLGLCRTPLGCCPARPQAWPQLSPLGSEIWARFDTQAATLAPRPSRAKPREAGASEAARSWARAKLASPEHRAAAVAQTSRPCGRPLAPWALASFSSLLSSYKLRPSELAEVSCSCYPDRRQSYQECCREKQPS
jgi:hypothetical protein